VSAWSRRFIQFRTLSVRLRLKSFNPRGQSRFARVNAFAETESRKALFFKKVIDHAPLAGIVEKKKGDSGCAAKKIVWWKKHDLTAGSFARQKNFLHVLFSEQKLPVRPIGISPGRYQSRLMEKSGRAQPRPLRLLHGGPREIARVLFPLLVICVRDLRHP